ncbi:DUF2786 domain-containing protein [Actinoplanes sp. NPDC048988]|uniref:DUF2786 domain-containing protein n=1 Tax=Actinoplanes sp. NPDC048988 TaxID=3363901 RepID=UPI003721E947
MRRKSDETRPQLADETVSQAVHAARAGRLHELEQCLMLLTGPLGGQQVNRALLTALLDEVRGCWARGWQPAELTRAARRDHSARHARLTGDVIAAQMRAHAAATTDHRWQAQIADLGATVWWKHDDLYLSAWGDREELPRLTTIVTAIETLCLLASLPPIELIVPPPGAPSSAVPAADLDQRTLSKVRALLAKAESTDFPEEAEACTAKAQELMARHRIDHALLTVTTGRRDHPASLRVAVDSPYEAPKTLLLQVVAEANSCRAVWTKRFGFSTLIGFPTDLNTTEILFTSLLVQATRAMTHEKSSARSFRQSFLTAYASRIGERLTAAVDEVTPSADLLPVLAARDDEVRSAVDKQFPHLTHRTTTISNRAGWLSGRAAADRAALHARQEVRHT